MNHENRFELTEEETHDLVRRGIASGRRKLVTRRVVSGVDEPAAASHELYDTLGSLLPDGMELSGFSAAEKSFSNPGRWAAFTLSEGADSSTGHVLVGPPGSYGDPDTCRAPACTLTPAGEGQVMFLDGAADDKDGSPASWTFVDPDGMQVTIFLERTDALMDSGLATSIVSDGAWAPIVADEAADPTP